MNCANCIKWGIRSTQGSARHDQEMKRLGYQQCLNDKTHEGVGRFVHGTQPKCAEFEVVKSANQA